MLGFAGVPAQGPGEGLGWELRWTAYSFLPGLSSFRKACMKVLTTEDPSTGQCALGTVLVMPPNELETLVDKAGLTATLESKLQTSRPKPS